MVHSYYPHVKSEGCFTSSALVYRVRLEYLDLTMKLPMMVAISAILILDRRRVSGASWTLLLNILINTYLKKLTRKRLRKSPDINHWLPHAHAHKCINPSMSYTYIIPILLTKYVYQALFALQIGVTDLPYDSLPLESKVNELKIPLGISINLIISLVSNLTRVKHLSRLFSRI